MAFIEKFSFNVNTGSKSVRVKDLTGLYNASTNPTGWDDGIILGPNPNFNAATEAKFTITLPTGIIISDIDVYPTLPNVDPSNIWYDITNVQLGYLITEKLPSGKYIVTYKVKIAGKWYVETCIKYILCEQECCIDKLHAKVIVNENSCPEIGDNLWNYVKAQAMLYSLKKAVKCSNFEDADEQLTLLDEFCNDPKTGCGCGCK